MTAAFKEWAVVVDALGTGQQIFILRKGGIHEGRGGFKLEHQAFALFPTLFHQQREGVIESARLRFDAIAPKLASGGQTFFVDYFCQVIESHHLANFQDLQRLHGQHIWREEVLRDRFEWGPLHGIFAIAVRVFRLPATLELPLIPEYGGCRSWIELAHAVSTIGAVPVLSDAAFDDRLLRFREVIGSAGG